MWTTSPTPPPSPQQSFSKADHTNHGEVKETTPRTPAKLQKEKGEGKDAFDLAHASGCARKEIRDATERPVLQ